jgi:hypothetical protein
MELGTGDTISGDLPKTVQTTPPTAQSRQLNLDGKDPQGVVIQFRGTLWLTNAPGVTVLRKKTDIRGALITGQLSNDRGASLAVESTFLP